MTGSRKSIQMQNEIFKLKDAAQSERKISRILGISRNTVRGILKNRSSSSEVVEALSESRAWSHSVPWDQIQSELSKKYVTIKQLAQEYAPEGIDYLRFWRELNRRCPEDLMKYVRIRMKHQPAERFEVDYCEGLPLTDRRTGIPQKTQLFVTASCFSDYTYAEFTLKQKKCEFIASQNRMFEFFGGVPEYLVVDNLKSGVFKAHRYDPDLNPTYCDYAHHMGFAVLPARPATPRDKPAVETAIGVIQRQFYAQMRNHTFYSIQQMNEKLRVYLDTLNHSLMKDYALTRAEQFKIELPRLKPIPAEAFEIVEYRNAKVHPDCHVQVDRCFYSVPYPWIGQRVRVKLRLNLIEIYNQDHHQIALHARAQGIGVFSTYDSHYPEQKVAAARLDVITLKKEAKRIGEQTLAVADELLSGNSPLRYLRRMQGIVRLAKALPSEAIEHGCKQARLFGRLRLRYITDCATQFHRNGARPVLVKAAPQRELSELFLHEKD